MVLLLLTLGLGTARAEALPLAELLALDDHASRVAELVSAHKVAADPQERRRYERALQVIDNVDDIPRLERATLDALLTNAYSPEFQVADGAVHASRQLRADLGTRSCPWDPLGADKIFVTPTRVKIDGMTWKVRGPKRVHAFDDVLASCGLRKARDAFASWRDARRLTNVGAALLVFPPIGAPIAISAGSVAGGMRQALETAILQGR